MFALAITGFTNEMDGGMFFRRYHLKVLWTIIKFITIDVVSKLSAFERSANLLLKDITSDVHLPPIDTHLSIARFHLVVRFMFGHTGIIT